MQDFEPEEKICGLVGVTCRQPLEQRAFELQRPQFIGRGNLLIGKAQAAVGKPRVDDGLLARGDDPDVTTRTEIDRQERIGRGRKPEPRARAGELDVDRPPVDADDAPDAELGIVAMGEVVPWFPGRRQRAVSRSMLSSRPGHHYVSRTIERARLSRRRPRNAEWRRWPSAVHSTNRTWATSVGFTQWNVAMSSGVIPSPHRDFPALFGRSPKGHLAV